MPLTKMEAHLAVSKGNVDMVSTLLSFDHCDVNRKGQLDRTALHVACEFGHVACIHELMACGAQIEAKDSCDKATPLHLAADFNHPDVVKILVDEYGASINVTDDDGLTALHRAALSGNPGVVRVLASNPQCDVMIRDSDGDTAADVARRRRHHVIVALLEDKSKGKLNKSNFWLNHLTCLSTKHLTSRVDVSSRAFKTVIERASCIRR